MSVTPANHGAPWTRFSIGLAVAAVVLGCLGLGAWLYQTASLTRERINALYPAARAVVTLVDERLHHAALEALRACAARVDAPAADAVGAAASGGGLFTDVFVVSADGLGSGMRGRTILDAAGRVEPGQVCFANVSSTQAGFGVVACSRFTGPDGPTVLAGDLNLEYVRRNIVEPCVMLCADLDFVDWDASPDPWALQLAPALPFWKVAPYDRFVARQRATGRWLSAIAIAIMVVGVGAVVGLVYGMNQVVRRQIALAEMKSSFVAGVSHELKTPLSMIRMFAETLRDGRVASPERAQEYYEIIARECTRLGCMIDNILDFSRRSAGKKEYRFQTVRVEDVVREVYESYRLDLDHRGFTHHLRIAEGLPAVTADPGAVAQAVINLLSNAVKYSDEDKFVEVAISKDTRRGRHGVWVSVTDRGIGIRPEDRAHVFDGFFRAGDAGVRRRSGAGLGLALVKEIAEAHRGFVEVESRLVRGSTFRIFLPAAGEGETSEPRAPARGPE